MVENENLQPECHVMFMLLPGPTLWVEFCFATYWGFHPESYFENSVIDRRVSISPSIGMYSQEKKCLFL